MFVVLVLFCLVNSVGGLAIDARNSVVKELKGQTASLTWTIIKSSGETILNGGINLIRPGNANSVAVAFIGLNNAVTVVSTYSDRGWTVSLTSQNLILSAKNLKEEDDATYTLNLFHQTGGKVKSKSKAIRLKVLVPPHYPTGSFTEGKKTYDEGQQVTLKCEPDGSPKPINIFWKKNSVFYKETDTPDSNLVFQNLSRIDTGKYTCEAVNDAGTANKIPTTDLVIKYRPVNTKFNVTSVLVDGKRGTLKCTAEADPKAQYTIGGESLSEQTSSSQEYHISRVQLKVNDKKKVTCRPFNRVGTGRTVQLILDVKVQPRILKALPRTMDAIEGKNFSIKCSAAAKPPANIVWLKNGSPLPNSPPSYIVGTLNDNTFKSEATLTLDPVKRQDNGIYTCNAENLYGRATSAVTLNLKFPPHIVIPPKRTIFLNESDRLLLFCNASGVPKPTIQWSRDEILLRNTGDLLIYVKYSDAGTYTCTASNGIEPNDTAMSVVTIYFRPVIVTNSTSYTMKGAESGAAVQLVCKAEALPLANLTWLYYGSRETVNETDKDVIEITKLENTILMRVKARIGAKYLCYANNNRGNTTQLYEIRPKVGVWGLTPTAGERSGLTRTEIIAIIAGIGGFLLIVILILFLCLVRRRQQPKRGKTTQKKRTSENIFIEENVGFEMEENEWEITRENIIIEKVIGKGSFGQVAKGVLRYKSKEKVFKEQVVAVKMTKEGCSDSDKKDLQSELNIMKCLPQHENVIQLLGCVTTTEPLLVVIGFIPFGDLLGYLRKSRGKDDRYFNDADIKPKTNLTSKELITFARDVTCGMEFLALNKVIHRDLAARNVLVGEEHVCKITDFGMARDVYQDNIYTKTSKGRIPVKWTAYESLMYNKYTTQSDVWSYGILLYEIFTIGGTPYPGVKCRDVYSLLKEGYRMEKPRHVDKELYSVMLQCWNTEPEERPPFSSLKKIMDKLERKHHVIM